MEAALTRRPLALAAALALAMAVALCPGVGVTAAETSPQEAVLLTKLRERVRAVDARLDGVLGVYVRDLTTGAPSLGRAAAAYSRSSATE
jgi:hypothetical protein